MKGIRPFAPLVILLIPATLALAVWSHAFSAPTAVPFDPYPARPATVVRVIDGDTAILRIDLGYDVSTTQSIRIEGYNAPEMHGPHPDQGRIARDELGRRLAEGPVWVKPTGHRTFARWVARLYVQHDDRLEDVGAALAAAGYSVPQGQ